MFMKVSIYKGFIIPKLELHLIWTKTFRYIFALLIIFLQCETVPLA